MSSDLKPCPFCGGTLVAYKDRFFHPDTEPTCYLDHVEVSFAGAGNAQNAAAWNRRAEARADSAVPSSHVSDQPDVLSDRGSGGAVRRPDGNTEPSQVGTWTLTAPDGRSWRADSPLKACGMEQRERVPASVAVERIIAALNELDPEEVEAAEAAIEAAFWQFDARRKGYAEWRQCPQSERDAFKAEARALVRGYWPTPLPSEAVCAEPAPTTASAPANSETDEPKESRESILREALARLVALFSKTDGHIHIEPFDDWVEFNLALKAARSALAGIPLNASGDPTERSG